MTPLAHKIVRELTLPLASRIFNDRCGLLARMDDIHCFEVSDVFDAASAVAESEALKERTLDVLAFLPAPKTWIEWRNIDGSREGVLLESEDGQIASARWAFGNEKLFLASDYVGQLKLRGDGSMHSRHHIVRWLVSETEARRRGWILFMYAVLAMINTPRIIGRTTHMPHAGLQRALAKAMGGCGKFPLRAYTEIKLIVGAPRIENGHQEIWLTGRRALHFVRAHLRVRQGQLGYVSAHWRGDAAVGIKRSRYKLVPPNDGSRPHL